MPLNILTNSYARRARLEPALIVVLPLALATLAWFPVEFLGWGLLWSLIVYCGGTALLTQVARDRGKNKEQRLYASWGGKPTTRFLRHRDAQNKVLLEHRHKKLQTLLPDVKMPSSAEEQPNPTLADEVYETCTLFLLEHTRDTKRFALLFEENCNYGFRRNLWGMKPLGITTSLLGSAAICILLVLNYRNAIALAPLAVVCAAVNLVLLLGWLTWFTPSWVRIAADAYAERLLATCEEL